MQNNRRHTRTQYRERLAPSLWVFVSISILGPMTSFAFAPLGSALSLVLGVGVTLVIIVFTILTAPLVSVDGNTLRVGRAHIDARWLGEPVQLRGDAARTARGPGLPGHGWHLIRGGIDGVVVVPITDPNDPVPSWTISTRTPDRLAAAIEAARTQAAHSLQMGPSEPS